MADDGGATFILIPKQPSDPAAAAAALDFFAWAYAKGDKMAVELDYAPMPKKVAGEMEKMWACQIKGSNGNSLHTSSTAYQVNVTLARCRRRTRASRRFARPHATAATNGRRYPCGLP